MPMPINKVSIKTSAVLLDNSKVIVLGPLGTEQYSIDNSCWLRLNTGSMKGFSDHTVTPLNDGSLLVVGGLHSNAGIAVQKDLLRFDPIHQIWTTVGSMIQARAGHTTTLIDSRRIVVIGGYINNSTDALVPQRNISTAEICDIINGRCEETSALPVPRAFHTATKLQDGRILVAGGLIISGHPLNPGAPDIYDPQTHRWTSETSSLVNNVKFLNGTATRLRNGNVLLLGGISPDNLRQANAILFDPMASDLMRWQKVDSYGLPCAYHDATLLGDGKVLVTGGMLPSETGACGGKASSDSWIFDQPKQAWTQGSKLKSPRAGHSAILFPDGKVRLFNGFARELEPITSVEVLRAN